MLSTWLLSIVGVVVLGVLIELVLSESGTSKFVKSIYAMVVLFVIISPLPKLIGQAESLQVGAPSINSELLQSINQTRKNQLEDLLEVRIGRGAVVTLDVDLNSMDFKILNVYVTGLNIDRKAAIETIKNVISVNEEDIFFYG